MKYVLAALVAIVLSAGVVFGNHPFETPFRRGDANNSGVVTVADASFITAWLFNGGPTPACLDAADANDDGVVTIPDVSFIMNWLFVGGPPPPDPGPLDCGFDPTSDSLTCLDSICP